MLVRRAIEPGYGLWVFPGRLRGPWRGDHCRRDPGSARRIGARRQARRPGQYLFLLRQLAHHRRLRRDASLAASSAATRSAWRRGSSRPIRSRGTSSPSAARPRRSETISMASGTSRGRRSLGTGNGRGGACGGRVLLYWASPQPWAPCELSTGSHEEHVYSAVVFAYFGRFRGGWLYGIRAHQLDDGPLVAGVSALMGTWASASVAPSPSSCTDFKWTVTDQTSTSAKGSFSCHVREQPGGRRHG